MTMGFENATMRDAGAGGQTTKSDTKSEAQYYISQLYQQNVQTL